MVKGLVPGHKLIKKERSGDVFIWVCECGENGSEVSLFSAGQSHGNHKRDEKDKK